MKKVFLYLAVAVAMLAACVKEAQISVNAPQDGKTIRTITAAVPVTKTSVEINDQKEGIYSWTADEQIAVCGKTEGVIPFKVVDRENGTFESVNAIDAAEELAYAVTPASALYSASDADEFYLVLESPYAYSDGTNAVMLAGAPIKGTDGNDQFTFRHVAGLMMVTYQNVPVGTLGLRYKTNKPIVGEFYFDSLTDVELTQPSIGDTEVQVRLASAVTQPNTTLQFYVPVPTGSYGSFEIALIDENLDDINGTVRSMTRDFSVNVADIVRIPKVVLDPVTITKGKDYILETSSSLQWSAIGTALEHESMSWLPEKIAGTDGAKVESFDSSRGAHFGSKNNGITTLRLTGSGYGTFCNSATACGISDIVITVGAANGTTISGTVTVGGTTVSAQAAGSDSYTAANNSSAEISFHSETLLVGDVVIDLTLSSTGALYIKSIAINPDTRTDPELHFEEASYSAVAGGSFTAPALLSVDGFSETVAYSLELVSAEDGIAAADIASVDASTGAVTLNGAAGTVAVTAAFDGEGNATYKSSSASYNLVVGPASLVVSETTTPAKAECTESSVTFTVTSNVAWAATTTADFVKSIEPASGNPATDPVTVTVTFNAQTSGGTERTATIDVKPSNQTVYSALNKTVSAVQKEYTADVIYELYSGEITEGSYLIVYDNAAMNSTVDGDRLQYTEVAPNANNQILNPGESIIWMIEADGEYWTLYNAAAAVYAASTGAKNKAKTEASVTDNSRWTVSGDATYEFVNKANAANNVNSNLRKNGTYGFACYATSTGGALSLYKLNDGKVKPTLSFTPASYTDEIGNIGNFVAPTVNKTEGLVVSFVSNNTDVATVTNAGIVALAGAVGEATITASAAEQTIGETTYRAAEATFTVKVTKTAPVIAFNNPTTSVNLGETVTNVATITPNTLSFTYSSSDETVATVTGAGVVTGVKAGTATITASRSGDASYEAASASYEITVVDPNANDGTQAKPYTASEAAARALDGSTASVYVKGIISSIATAYSSTNNNISFWISEDGSANTFEIYRGAATSEDQFLVGDYVVFQGSLTKFNSTPELAAGGTCSSQVKAPRFSVEAGAYASAQTLELTADSGATIYYTTDGNAPTTSSSTYSSTISISESMTVKAFAVKDGITTGIVTHVYTIDANANDGTQAKPYTASEAAALALGESTASVYVKGIISSIATAYSSTNNNISFWISEDGSANTFEIYRGEATSADQFLVGDYVVFHGSLTKYNTTPELAQGGTCSSQVKAPRFTPDGGNFSTASQSVTLTADAGATIYYSLDSSDPTTAYTGAITLTATTTVKAKAVLGDITTGVVSKTFTQTNASTETLTVGTNGNTTWSNGNKTASATVGDVSFTALGSGGNDGKYYSSDNSWRFYTASTSGVKITVPSGKKITSVIVKWKTGQPVTPSGFTANGATSPTTYTAQSGTEVNEVSFVRNSSANFLAQEITVTYE